MAELTLAEYDIGDSLSDLRVFWIADDGTYRDFSGGAPVWTFEIKVGDANGIKFTKTTAITGAAGSATVPSIVAAWATANELSTITVPGDYYCQVRAIRTVDGKKLTKRGVIRLKPSS